MKVMSFLGTGNYQSTTYCYGIQECTTHLFPHAVTRFVAPDELLVCLTPGAKITIPQGQTQTHFEHLCALHQREGLVPPLPVDIPNGSSTAELWDMFTILAQQLSPGDDVVFDITHGFRSLPMLIILAAAYLRVAKQVTLRAILYGAFEAKDAASNRTPVFELSPFLSLLDWTTATEQFLQTGNAQALAERLHQAAPRTKALTDHLEGIAQGLHLLRPLDVMRRAAEVPERIKAATPTITRTAPPFTTLLERISVDYGRFGLHDPVRPANAPQFLLRLLDLAEWYLAKEQIAHALAIAREWLPTLLCYRFRLDVLDREAREAMEALLGEETMRQITVRGHICQWANVPHGARLRHLWGEPTRLASLRNDVLHAGFRKRPQSAREIIKQTTAILTELRTLAQLWNLEGRTL